MSYSQGSKITSSDIVNYAYNYIINQIVGSCYTSGTIPKSPMGNSVVPKGYLASSTYFSRPNMGYSGSKVKGKDDGANFHKEITTMSIYNALVYLTKQLLSIGTFSYKERKVYTKKNDNNYYYKNKWSTSGRCIFNSSTVYTYLGGSTITDLPLEAVADGGVVTPNKISISLINALCTNCVSSYRASSKIHCDYVYSLCHENCHAECHNECNCNCHDFENCNFNNHLAEEADPNYQCEVCECYWNNPWTYGGLPDNGSNDNCDGGDCDGAFNCHSNTVSNIQLYTYKG